MERQKPEGDETEDKGGRLSADDNYAAAACG